MKKSKSLLSTVVRVFGAAISVLAIVSCGDKGDPLPGGYSIFIAGSSEIFLEEPKYGGSIPELGTDLEAIGNYNEFIFGRSGSDRGVLQGISC